MLYRFRRALSLAWFDLAARRVLRTPPVVCDPESPLALVSQLCHRDIYMYLAALKSFTRYKTPGRVFVLDDGSLRPEDKSTLERHVDRIEVLPVTKFGSPICPKAGCWERLLFIAGLVQKHFVVQLDADTLTLKRPTEVLEAIEAGRGFTLGTSEGRTRVTLTEISEYVNRVVPPEDTHVQVMAEKSFGRLPDADKRFYVRGCAAFTGFPRLSFTREDVEKFSLQIDEQLGGGKWSEWGSEQVTSNYIVANTDDPHILPIDRYATHEPDVDLDIAAFLHFIGSFRFTGGRYRSLVSNVVREIRAKRAAAGA